MVRLQVMDKGAAKLGLRSNPSNTRILYMTRIGWRGLCQCSEDQRW